MALLRPWLLILAVLGGALLLACNGDDGDGDGGDGGEPAVTQPADGEDGEDGDGDGDGADDGADGGGQSDSSFGDIPLPGGADETDSGSFSSSDIPFFVPDPDFDSEAFTNIEFKQYELDGSADDVIDFYKDALGDWEEVFVFSGGADGEASGLGVWTSDDGATAVWVSASETGDATELMVILGTQE